MLVVYRRKFQNVYFCDICLEQTMDSRFLWIYFASWGWRLSYQKHLQIWIENELKQPGVGTWVVGLCKLSKVCPAITHTTLDNLHSQTDMRGLSMSMCFHLDRSPRYSPVSPQQWGHIEGQSSVWTSSDSEEDVHTEEWPSMWTVRWEARSYQSVSWHCLILLNLSSVFTLHIFAKFTTYAYV